MFSNLITNRVWSKARSEMGYFKVNHNLDDINEKELKNLEKIFVLFSSFVE